METLLFLLGYALVAGICILVGRGMWRAWCRHRSAGETTLPAAIRPGAMQTPMPPILTPQPLVADLLCKLPPAGWSCSRPRGHEGPCAARLQTPTYTVDTYRDALRGLRPGRVIECDRPQDKSWSIVTPPRREPLTYEDGLTILRDATIYLLTRAMADGDSMQILDKATFEVMREIRRTPPTRRRVLADSLEQQWRLGR